MTEKKCTRCGSVWTMAWAKKCVFCGGEGVELASPEPAPPARAAATAVERALQKTSNGRHAAAATKTAPVREARTPEPPPALAEAPPRLDPPILALILGLSVLAICALLPALVKAGGWISVLGLGLAGAVAVAAPVAWFLIQRHEAECRAAGSPVPTFIRLARTLTMVATFLVVFEIATFTVFLMSRGVAAAG